MRAFLPADGARRRRRRRGAGLRRCAFGPPVRTLVESAQALVLVFFPGKELARCVQGVRRLWSEANTAERFPPARSDLPAPAVRELLRKRARRTRALRSAPENPSVRVETVAAFAARGQHILQKSRVDFSLELARCVPGCGSRRGRCPRGGRAFRRLPSSGRRPGRDRKAATSASKYFVSRFSSS